MAGKSYKRRHRVGTYARLAVAGIKHVRQAVRSYRKAKPRRTSAPKNRRLLKTSGGQGSSNASNLVVRYKPMKVTGYMKAIGNVATYMELKKWAVFSTQSLQHANTVDYIANSTELKLVYNAAARFYNTTGSAYVTQSATTTSSLSKKFLLKSVHSQITITNQSPSNAHVELLVLQSRSSNVGGDSPETRWNSGLSGDAVGQSSMNHDTPFAVPTTSKIFNLYWRIIKKVKLVMVPGQDHMHSFNFVPNRILDTSYINEFGEIKGITHAFMIITRGTPADDTLSATTATKIGLTATKIIGTVKNTYKTVLIDSFPRNTTFTSDLDTDATSMYVENEVQAGPVNAILNSNFA